MSNKHVLVVEDDPDGAEMLSTALAHMSLDVDTTGNGTQASQLLLDTNNHFDAAIIDLALPGKDGWEVLKDVLNNPQTKSMPCIAVTAYHTSKLREEALRAGFVAYFPKPIDATELVSELNRLL